MNEHGNRTLTLDAPPAAPPRLRPLYQVDERLAPLYEEIADCPRCQLARTRSRTVPGSGPASARLMLIGEGPGQQEDELGLPFVGRAGQFLDELLATIGLVRGDVYVANVVKCRPPGNRDPLPEELAACSGYLDRQIAIVDPRVIATLGRFSMARWFADARISRIHGQVARFEGRTVIAMYHPAAALRNPALRDVMRQDFARIPALLDDAPSRSADVSHAPPALTHEPPAQPTHPAPDADALTEEALDAPAWRDPPQERLL
ncbi:MAG: uracil-DNA glycosylase [Dehalococcoidia bacterium]